MNGQSSASFVNRMDNRIAESLVLKMFAHMIDNSLPKLFPAFLMNRFVADDRKFVRAGRDENKDCVAVMRLVHPQLVKFSLRRDHRIDIQLSALKIDANLAGGF